MQTTPEILLGAYIAIAAEDAQPLPVVTAFLGNFHWNTRAARDFAQECRPFTSAYGSPL
jgi:hypothetical protein